MLFLLVICICCYDIYNYKIYGDSVMGLGLMFPRYSLTGSRKYEVVWEALTPANAIHFLYNPGMPEHNFYGRIRPRRNGNGGTTPRVVRRPHDGALLLPAGWQGGLGVPLRAGPYVIWTDPKYQGS